MTFVGLDFGTSNSSIAQVQDESIRLFTLDPGNLNPKMLRSFIFITRDHEQLVGSEAVWKYLELETGRPVYWETRNMGQVKMVVGSGGSGPIVYWDDLLIQVDSNAQGRLLQSIKTALRNPNYEGTNVFDQYYPVEDLIAILLGALRERCQKELEREIEGVVIGRPVKFSDDPNVDARAQAKIELSAQKAGFKTVQFESEPVAAAYVYHKKARERQNILVFDFGGGTLDFTVIRIGGESAPELLATHGELIGGDDFDRQLMQPMRKYFGEGATMRDRTPFPAHLLGLLDSWQTMVNLSRPEYRSILRSARRGSDPESIRRLESLVNRNLGFKLFQALEAAKIQLSSQATAYVTLNKDGLRLRELFTRPQFERLIDPYLDQIDQAVNEVLLQSGLGVNQIHAVLRTGGSSEIPAVIHLLTQKFGGARLEVLSPFTTIVGGLAIRAAELST